MPDMPNILILTNSREARNSPKAREIQKRMGGKVRFTFPGDALTGSKFDIIFDAIDLRDMYERDREQYFEFRNIVQCRLAPNGIMMDLY